MAVWVGCGPSCCRCHCECSEAAGWRDAQLRAVPLSREVVDAVAERARERLARWEANGWVA